MYKNFLNRNLMFLGLIKRAGHLQVGDEAVQAAARSGRAKLIIAASDASDGSKRRAKGYADTCNVRFLSSPWTKHDFGVMLNRGGVAMMAVTDAGFAKSLSRKLEETDVGDSSDGFEQSENLLSDERALPDRAED
ncbi:MAG: hypothetical protein LBN02_07950 [Oscillospiraceae bacterium]|jgi:ribosomal protein L30E|nr:hypothetical protein [Oscillospiraceae bacterium]